MTTPAHNILEQRREILTRKQNENDLLRRQTDELEKRILGLVESLNIAEEGLAFLEDLANSRRGAMKGKIEAVVSEALQMIYGPSYRAELSYSVKNNRSHMVVEMVRKTKAGDVRRDIDGFGGGVADTISVPLRLMVLMGSKQTDKVCILDECWKHVDPERVEVVGQFLRLLADKLKIQVVLCSHHDMLRKFADRTYEVSESVGISKVDAF